MSLKNSTFSLVFLIVLAVALSFPVSAQSQLNDYKAINPSTLPPAHGYSHIVIAPPGRIVSISGQVAMDSTGQVVGFGNFKVQCIQVHENLRRALQSVGLSFNNVIRTDIYVTTLEHLSTLRKCRARYLPHESPPTATLHKVSALFHPELMIEVAVTAVMPNTSKR